MQFQFSVCMYGTCGRIDNKADFDFLTLKSLLLSHHHSTCALMSEILESVLHTVQKQLTYRQYHYLLTDLYRQCAIYTYIYSVHTVYC